MDISQCRNYDLIMSDRNEMYLYLNSSWFWVNKPGGEESRARKKLPEGREWTQLQSLREIAQEATDVENNEPVPTTTLFPSNMSSKEAEELRKKWTTVLNAYEKNGSINPSMMYGTLYDAEWK